MIRAVRIRTERRQVLRDAFPKALTTHRANVPAKIARAVGECARAAILPLGFASVPPETGTSLGDKYSFNYACQCIVESCYAMYPVATSFYIEDMVER